MSKPINIILIADNELTRQMGLMHRKPLKKTECAFFNFPREGKHSFWNKNVDFPISLIFCDSEQKVQDVKFLEAQQLNSVTSDSFDIKYVIEAHKEAPSLFDIKKGAKAVIENNSIIFKEE